MNKELEDIRGKLYINPPEEFADDLKNMPINTRLDLVSKSGNLFSFVRMAENWYFVGLL